MLLLLPLRFLLLVLVLQHCQPSIFPRRIAGTVASVSAQVLPTDSDSEDYSDENSDSSDDHDDPNNIIMMQQRMTVCEEKNHHDNNTPDRASVCYASTRNNDHGSSSSNSIDAAGLEREEEEQQEEEEANVELKLPTTKEEELALLYGEPQDFQGINTGTSTTAATTTNSSQSTATNTSEESSSSSSSSSLALQWLQFIDNYMRNEVFVQERYKDVRTACTNDHKLCTYWASIGECDKNPAYMRTKCGPACRTCHDLIFEERCPMPYDANDVTSRTALNALKKRGDLQAFFERLTTHHDYQMYQPAVLHRPPTDPWIIVLDQFLSEYECNVLIELGGTVGYKQSKNVGERRPDGSYAGKESTGRTSTNAWCQPEACFANATVQNVLQRIANVTGIPDSHSEFLQLLKYEVGQFYDSHHDYIDHHVQRAQGPRILTLFLYLNDVEAGGATHFPNLNVSVFPKRGRALIWPSVLEETESTTEEVDEQRELFVTKDPRTQHQALPVEAGVKYGANAWIHLRDFKTPYNRSCI